MRVDWRRAARAFVLLAGLCAARPALAEEWHEAYRAGVQALTRGNPQGAVAPLRRAIALRPEPGRNVVTYGTNIESRYFPYLRLTEAYLALGQLDLARETLEASAAHKGEPAEERKALQARLDGALEARRPPPTTVAAAPLPTAPPATEPALPPVTSLAAPPITIPPTAPPAHREAPTPARLAPPVVPQATPAPAPMPSPAAGSIAIVSKPGGAQAYVDDEPVGATDPETGRLVKGGLAPGRHRVRVSREGYADAVAELELRAGEQQAFETTLKARATGAALNVGWLAFGAVALALVSAVAWTVLRRPTAAAPLWKPSTPPAAAGEPRTPSGNLNPGARRDALGQEWFGEFRLLQMLGRGGMASVYKAERQGELQALKRPLSNFLDDPDFMARFLREADIGRTLNHPNIVRILGRGYVDDVPYFTMELLEGDTLQAFVASRGATPPREATALVAQIAEALDFAHSKGVVHRDLKPSNVMRLPDGTAKVMDFGIARAVRFDGLTATGAFLGTPDYVAPEVIEGRGAEPRSDLYALGAVFYELLTGERPFPGESAFAILRKHCSDPVRPPSQLVPGLPAELDRLVVRLLAKTPESRLASAEELVVALRDWLNRAA
jgi:hypothetical protein